MNTSELPNGEWQQKQMSTDPDEQCEETTNGTFECAADRPVSEQVVEAVASVAGKRITELEPLNDAVDADALNSLFASKHDGSLRRGGYLAFEYAGHFVTVFASGRIEVTGTF